MESIQASVYCMLPPECCSYPMPDVHDRLWLGTGKLLLFVYFISNTMMPRSTGRAEVQISTLSSRLLPIVILLGKKKQHLYLHRQLSCVCSPTLWGNAGCLTLFFPPAFLSRSRFRVRFAWCLCRFLLCPACHAPYVRPFLKHSAVHHLLFAAHTNDVTFASVETPVYLESCFCCFYAKQEPLLTCCVQL